MEKRFVSCPEPVAIVLKQRRWHRGIPEPWMLLHARGPALGDIPPSRFESCVIALSGCIGILRRRGWRSVDDRRLGVGTSRQRDGH
jgi:hypothetical protein